MSRDQSAAQVLPFHVRFGAHPAGLRAHVTGESNLANTLAYWQAIVAEVRRHRPRGLLVLDEMHGTPLEAAEWKQLVDAIPREVMGPVRVAHVRPSGLRELEYCEIFAREAGFTARVFQSEHEADVWLRYGER